MSCLYSYKCSHGPFSVLPHIGMHISIVNVKIICKNTSQRKGVKIDLKYSHHNHLQLDPFEIEEDLMTKKVRQHTLCRYVEIEKELPTLWLLRFL